MPRAGFEIDIIEKEGTESTAIGLGTIGMTCIPIHCPFEVPSSSDCATNVKEGARSVVCIQESATMTSYGNAYGQVSQPR